MRFVSAMGLLTGLAVASTAGTARATLLAQEDFGGYTVGQPLAGQGTATNGFAGAWRPAAFAFFDPALNVQASPVVDPAIVSSGQSAAGGFTRIYRDLSPTVAAQTATQATYLSFTGGAFFLSQFDVAFGSDADADHVAEYATTNDSKGNIGSQINIQNTNLPKSSGEDISTILGNTSKPYGDPQSPDLYVIKFDPINRTVGYYVFYNGVRPTSVNDASLSDTFPIDLTCDAAYDRIGLFTVEGPSTTGISNIRIGTQFSDVAPLTPASPEPASLALLAIGSAGLLLRKPRA